MKPIMPPALLTPQILDESYYYDQSPMIPHPAIPAFHSQAYDSQQRSRLWRSVDDPIMGTMPANNVRQFPPAFSPLKSSLGRSNNPSQRFPPASQFQQLQQGMRGFGPQNRPRRGPIEFDRMDPFNEESPFIRGNPFTKGDPFANRNQFNKGDSFNPGNPFNKPNADIIPPGLPPPSMKNPWEPKMRFGPMRRQSPGMLRNVGRGRFQALDLDPVDHSSSSSEELMVPRSRKASPLMIPQQGINNPLQGPMNRLGQRPWANRGNADALGASINMHPPLPMQYGVDSPDYFESRQPPQSANSPLMMRSTPPRSRMTDVEDFIGQGNGGGLLKVPIVGKT